MLLVVCYDVSTIEEDGPRRLRKIAEACKDYGVRVQKSTFECRIDAKDWVVLRKRLLSILDPKQDSVRIYFIGDDDAKKTEHHGTNIPLDPTGPLIF